MDRASDSSVLVTGAGGFIGGFLCRRLIDEGFRVVALAMPGEDTESLEKIGISVRRGDLTRPKTIRGVCDGCGAIYHLAGRVTYWGTRSEFHDAICRATENLLDEAGGSGRRFVHASSVVAIGLGPRHRRGHHETDPIEKTGIFYGDAKLDAEARVFEQHRAGKVKATVIRPTNVIGPGSVWVRDAIENLSKPFLPLIDGGRWSASLVYVDNLVDAFILAGTREEAVGQIYQVRDDYKVSWKQYFLDIASIVDKDITPYTFISVPFRRAWAIAGISGAICAPLHIKTTLTRHNVGMMGRDNDIDNSKIKHELGWRTRIGYEEAMKRIAEWIRQEGLAG